MTKKQLIETIRRVIKETLNEANPLTSPKPDVAEPGTEVEDDPFLPSKEEEDDDLRVGNPTIKPKYIPAKATKEPTPKEKEIIKKIINKVSSLKERKSKFK